MRIIPSSFENSYITANAPRLQTCISTQRTETKDYSFAHNLLYAHNTAKQMVVTDKSLHNSSVFVLPQDSFNHVKQN
jgi:transposase-like protein